MTNLTNAIEKLTSHLQRKLPGFVEEFQPGISFAEIQSALSTLEYTLPDDFYELYQWRNGHPDGSRQSLGPVYDFNPIELIVQEKDWSSFGDSPPMYKGRQNLPFITNNSEFFSIVLGRSYAEQSHIVFVDELGETVLQYDSITSMFESIADCFELGAYYLNDDGWIEENSALSSEVLRSRNPKTIVEAMVDIQNVVDTYECDDNENSENYSKITTMLSSALQTLRRFRPPEAIKLVQSVLGRLEDVAPSKRTNAARFTLNAWLQDVEAL